MTTRQRLWGTDGQLNSIRRQWMLLTDGTMPNATADRLTACKRVWARLVAIADRFEATT